MILITGILGNKFQCKDDTVSLTETSISIKMSTPSLLINKDDLREQEYFNYSAIDQYWHDKGMTEESLRIQYKIALTIAVLVFIGLLCLYYATYSTRKKMSLAKHLGVEQKTCWETFCQNF
ncbi:unnamed protein product [Oikopleura dioica]|uniref:Uncharacterized protein n=1 Tax=Oikopleura dioica TaxID=34765 RepID=E4XRR4_OIKDI|nr:unnamed protein product [Oikopleura dioica]